MRVADAHAAGVGLAQLQRVAVARPAGADARHAPQRGDGEEVALDAQMVHTTPRGVGEVEPAVRPLHRHQRDPDTRGWTVEGSDGKPAGEIVDLWFNRAEFFLRYFEVRPEGAPDRTVLLPLFFCNVNARAKKVVVRSMPAARVAETPGRRRHDRITLLEEDKVNAFFAGGWFHGRHPLGETTPRT